MPDIDRICYNCMGNIDEPGMICPNCGWDNAIREDEYGRLPSMTLKKGRFFIGRPLGQGGFGVTYLGRDLYAGQFEDSRRAIKEFFPRGMALRKNDGITVSPADSKYTETFEKRQARSQREGERMASVSKDVNNVVRAYDCFQENGTTYIVMEYIDGDTLSTIVRQNGPFSWRAAYATLKPVLVALKKMHDRQIYHMDISPENIMLRKRSDGTYGDPYILDFGASIEVGGSDVTKSKSSMTVHDGYTPPEQYSISSVEISENASETACMDEYAICATMYFIISGQVPTSSTARLTGSKVAPLSGFDGTIPPYFENAIARGMSLRVQDRFEDMDALIEALENTPRRQSGGEEKKGFGWAKLLVIAGILAVCAAAVILLWTRRPVDPGPVRLDAAGTFTWSSEKGARGTLVGKAGDQEVRYALEDGETVAIPATLLDRFEWTLEETRQDGTTDGRAIQGAQASEAIG